MAIKSQITILSYLKSLQNHSPGVHAHMLFNTVSLRSVTTHLCLLVTVSQKTTHFGKVSEAHLGQAF